MLPAFITKELLALRRDPHALAVLFLMPTAFILVMSLALRDSFRLDAESTLRVVVIDEDQSPASRRLLQVAGTQATPPSAVDDARAALRRREGTSGGSVAPMFAACTRCQCSESLGLSRFFQINTPLHGAIMP